MLGLRLPELLLILAVVLIIFGANKLPQLGAGLGKGLQSFKKAFGGEARDEPPSEGTPIPPPAAEPPEGRPPSSPPN
jgi:sec-independent protein translocase protein TatA